MNTDFLVDEDELGILSQKRIKREIKTYNRALLFNRKELDSLRQKGLETIRRFSEGKVKLDGNISGLCTYDECDLMDSYIKIFGRNNDDIRKNAYVELNRIAPVQHGRHRKSFVSRVYDWRSRKIYKLAKSRMGKRLQSIVTLFSFNKSAKEQNDAKLNKQQNEELLRQQTAEERRQTNPKRSRAKAFMLTALIGLAGVAGIFGVGKLAKDGSNKEKSDNIKIVKIDSVRNDTSKDTISVILANKQTYQQQVKETKTAADTIKSVSIKKQKAKSAAQTNKKVVKTQAKDKKAAPQSKKVSKDAIVAEDIVLFDTVQNYKPQSDTTLSDTISIVDVDAINTAMIDTAFSQDSIITSKDSIGLAVSDTSTLSIVPETDSLLTISDSVANFDTIQSLSVADTINIEDVLNDTVTVPQNLIIDSIAGNDSLQVAEQHHALTKAQARHVKECDSVLSAACGGEAQRDSLYAQVIEHIDAGDFNIPSDMHLSDFTANMVYWSISSDKEKRNIGEKMLSGEKLTAEQQIKVDSMECWNIAVPRIISGLGIRGVYIVPVSANNNDNANVNDTTTTIKTDKVTKKQRSSGNTSLKEYNPRTKEAQSLLQKLYNSNRLYHRAR
ncbi:MAG: hypothetical protein IKK52_04345 [Alphaproteobacteria bacterium]|nr:hypothetical protein [Alphaproteobacteria bacterium]